MNDSLKALVELAAAAANLPLDEDLSVEDQYPELVAPLMRFEMLLKRNTDEIIKGHLDITKADLIQVKGLYDKSYLMSLQIPYDGIQRLCKELLDLCRRYEVKPSPIWQTFGEGSFDWTTDIEYMSTL